MAPTPSSPDRRAAGRAWAVAVLCAPAALPGCDAAVPPSFDDPVPEARLGAIAAGPDASSAGEMRHLVENLSSDDPVVRLAAIGALRRRTGRTLGYRFDAPDAERDAAIGRWQAELRGGPTK